MLATNSFFYDHFSTAKLKSAIKQAIWKEVKRVFDEEIDSSTLNVAKEVPSKILYMRVYTEKEG